MKKIGRIIYYVYFNLLGLVICGLLIFHGIQVGKELSSLIILTIISVISVNLALFILEKLTNKLTDYIIEKYERHKAKNLSLFDWMGESSWINLYDNLSKIKGVDRTAFYKNHERIKLEIKKEFKDKEKLKAFRLHLEIKVDSSNLTNLYTLTQTILIALMTLLLSGLITGLIREKITFNLVFIISLATFFFVWIILLRITRFISCEIDKQKLLLRLVTECIDENTVRNNPLNKWYNKFFEGEGF